jgi:hypothetical protein
MASENRQVILYHEKSGNYADQFGKIVSPFPIDQKREHTSEEIELVSRGDMDRVRELVENNCKPPDSHCECWMCELRTLLRIEDNDE